MSFPIRHILYTKQLTIMIAVLVLVPFVLYYPSLYYEFLPLLDDKWLIITNSAIKDFSVQGIINLFINDTTDLHYMPVTYVSYSIDYFLFGLNPFIFKLHNLLLHILSGILLFIFINLLVKERWIAFLVALFFLIHPINIESVVWASDRKQSLFYFYLLASLISYKLFLENPSRKQSKFLYLLSIVLWIISTMAKATAITLPGVFVILYIHENRDAIKIKTIARQILPMLPFVLLFWYLNKVANDRNILTRDFSYSTLEHLIFAGYSYSYYWVKSLFPFPLAVFYPAPSEHLPIPSVYPIMFVSSLLIIGLMFYHLIKKQNALFFALGYYTISILPLLNLMYYPLGDIPMLVANRYFYHSSLGILLYLILILNKILKNTPIKTTIFLSYILLLIFLFRVHLPVWQDEIRVFENDVKYYPSEDFFYKLSIFHDKKGETQKALNYLEKGDALGKNIWINNIWIFYQERSHIYLKAKKYDKALNDINTAIQKKEFKTPHFDSILEIDKKKIEETIKKSTTVK